MLSSAILVPLTASAAIFAVVTALSLIFVVPIISVGIDELVFDNAPI